jgi:DNA-binding beta-propeller fold protein YncE
VYIADTESHTIRRIDPKTGIIETIAGAGTRGDGPDGPPRACRFARPHGIFVDRAGAIYIADSENHRIRVLKD